MLPIHELPVPGARGLIGLSRCPGLRAMPDGTSDAAGQPPTDLARIARWGASAILTLVESWELRALGVAPCCGAAWPRADAS